MLLYTKSDCFAKSIWRQFSIKFLCIFILLLLPVFANPVCAFSQEIDLNLEPSDLPEQQPEEFPIEQMRRRITGDAPNELMTFSLGDAEVSLFLTGFWNGTLQFNPAFSFSPIGMSFSPFNSPFFMQEADLTMSLWLNEKWFVEANFLDDSSQNTYRAGFQGLSGDFLQYAGIGNTGLDFPSFPYMDLGGGSTSSFGFYSRFGTERLNFHALFRYDTSSREEKIFTGSRERTYSYVQVWDSMRGVSFILPDTDIDQKVTVYIEDERGEIIDINARRWRIALSSEYAFSASFGLLELSIRPKGMVAISYSRSGNSTPWQTSMGSYNSSGFLFDVQQWFNSSGKIIRLEDYPQAGSNSSEPGVIIFNINEIALVIYEPGTFSPFERRNLYEAPSSTSERAALVSLSSGDEISGYNLIPFDNSQTGFLDMLGFSASVVSSRTIYELLKDNNSRRDMQTMWPLVQEYPEIYLMPSGIFSGDIALRFTNYNSNSGYFIGTDAIPGSVQVWRSGIQDTNFNYNSSTGEVIMIGSVGQNEIIRITYLKKSSEANLGSIAAGIGAVYKGKSAFSALAAIGLRMNILDESYSNESQSSSGLIGVSAKASWDYDSLKAYVTGAFAYEQTDITGLYRVSGMEGNEIILSLPSEHSFISNPPSSNLALNLLNRADLIYRNYFSNSILGSNLTDINSNASVVSGINRPYPAKDRLLGENQVLVAEFDLNSNDKWTGYQVPLNYDADILSRAGEIEIPFRLYDFNKTPGNLKVIIQIGSLSGRDFAFTENIKLIWERVIFSNDWTDAPDTFINDKNFNTNPKIVRFLLSDEDRLKLANAQYLRLIVTSSDDITGRIILAQPIVRGSSFRAVTSSALGVNAENNDRVTAVETIDTGNTLIQKYPEIIRRLHVLQNSTETKLDTQRVLKIDWKINETGVSAGADTRVSLIPLSDYRELSFFIKPVQIVSNAILRFKIASGPDSVNNIFSVNIPASYFTMGEWSKVTIRYQGENKGIRIDGIKAENASFLYNPQNHQNDHFQIREGNSNYIAIFIDPLNSEIIEDGTIYLDEILLEDAIISYRMNAGAGIDYSKKGTIVSIGKADVLSDFYVSTAFESEARIQTQLENQDIKGSFINRTGAKISVFGIKIQGNISSAIADDTFLWSADHDISKTIGAFSVKESFYASVSDRIAHHNFNIAFNSKFFIKFEADAYYDFYRLRQNWNFDIGYIPANLYIPSIKVNSQAVWLKNEQLNIDDNYAQLWISSWRPLIPDSGVGSESRRTKSQFVLTQRTKPVGAVISIEGDTLSSRINEISQFNNSTFLDVPVNLNKLIFNFRVGRTYKTHLSFLGKDILEDSKQYFNITEESLAFWEVFPFYSLFSEDLNNAMDKVINDSFLIQYANFNDHFSARLTLPSVYNLASFLIPARITLRIDRIIEQKYDTRADFLNIGTSLTFSSINMFGAMGYSPLFKFYQTDEFNNSIDVSVVIPQNNSDSEDISFRLQSVINAGFRGFSGSRLKFENIFTMRKNNLSDLYWTESFIASWEAPVKKSFINIIYNWIKKTAEKESSWLGLSSFLSSNYESFRRESIELIIDKYSLNLLSVNNDYLRWALSIGHEEIIRILGRLNLSAFCKFKISDDQYSETFKFDILLGTALRISF
ncbi:MAG: hypothetical protein FWB86_04305 [Treponema sp.]|nr:hypothetical protein [Treponema sp.]MCL2250306.1 hypothetical protein [Treponema sp.]